MRQCYSLVWNKEDSQLNSGLNKQNSGRHLLQLSSWLDTVRQFHVISGVLRTTKQLSTTGTEAPHQAMSPTIKQHSRRWLFYHPQWPVALTLNIQCFCSQLEHKAWLPLKIHYLILSCLSHCSSLYPWHDHLYKQLNMRDHACDTLIVFALNTAWPWQVTSSKDE